MAACTSINMFNDLVEGFISQYEEILKDDTLSEIESADTQAVLEELYSYRKAIKENDREFINTQGFVSQRDADRQEVLQMTFRDVLGETFSFTYGNSKKVRQGTLVSAKPSKGGIRIEFIENGLPKSYSFSLTTDSRSQNSKKGNTYINIPGLRKVLDNYTYNLEVKEQLELVFGSSDANIKLDEKYRQKDYIHGSIEHMKSMLKKLHLLGGEKANQEELDAYLDLIDQMSPEFFNSLELYVNEQANRSEGTARTRRIDIKVSSTPKKSGNQQSEASIYMEEIIHSMTASAMAANTPESRKLKRQLESLIETARKTVKWQDFLPETSIDKDAEEKHAKWLYSYIFGVNQEHRKNADYEFIAKALTVPEVTKAFKRIKVKEGKDNRRLLEKVNDFFAAIMDVINGTFLLKAKNDNVHEALLNLAFELGEINTRSQREVIAKGGYMVALFDVVNNIDAAVAHKLNEIKNKILGDSATAKLEDMPEDGLYARTKWLGKFITLTLVNPSYTKAMGAIATAWGMKPGSLIREVIGGMFATDSAQKVAEFLTMQSGYIDKLRNNQIDLVRKNVLSQFDNPNEITKELEEALTAILADTDLASLFGKDSVAKDTDLRKTVFDNEMLRKLLTDDATLDRLIKDAKRALKEMDNTHYYWHSNQAVGLGIYMATHRGTPEQNLNATNIARGIHSSHRKKPKDNVVKAIDELATLVAIKNTDKDQRNAVAELMKTQWKGVQHVADVVEGFKKNSDETVFKGRKTNKIKGYTREVFDDTIVMEVAPLEDKEKMEAQGFIFRGTLAPRAGDVRNKPMALYVTDSAGRPDRLRGGVRLNQVKSKGTTITDVSYKDGEGFSNGVIRERAQRDINNIQRAALDRAKKMEIGEYDFTDTIFGVTAVLNENGKVTDYRYMMDKETKKQLLKQDTRISEVMARSFGTVLDKDMSAQHNKKVLEVIKQDMKDNWTAGTKGNDGLTDYTVIGPNVADPEMRKLYYMLPREFQEMIQARDDKTLAVRSDLHHLFFGYSHISIANFPGLAKITPPVLMKVIKFAEMMWMEMIKIVKTNILMKMPTILLSNIFSNFVYGVMRGYDPLTLAKMYVESYRDISDYNKQVKEVQELKNAERELSVGLGREVLSEQRKKAAALELQRTRAKITALERRLEDSPIHELVQLGLDQNVEDVTNDTDRDTNRITSFFDEQLQKAPEIVRNGTDILFITKRTKFYKIANEFLETSDLVARDIQNRLEQKTEIKQADGQRTLPAWWLEKQSKGYPTKQRLTGKERKTFLEEAKKQRQYDLVEDFINYTKPSSRMEEYLNKVGILMFTKYVKRIQRIIMKTSGNAPLKAFAGLMSISYMGGLPSIHEQSFLAKDWYGDSLGPGNVFPVYSPADQFMNFITPSLLKSSTYDFSL
jgi:hypothetical protein